VLCPQGPAQPLDYEETVQGCLGGEGEQRCPVTYFGVMAGFAVGPVKLGWHPLQENTSPEEVGQRCIKVFPDCVKVWKLHSSSFRDRDWKCPSFYRS